MENQTVVILCPMDCECELLLSKLCEKTQKHIGGYNFYEGTLDSLPVVIVKCLMGNVNSAVCTAYSIEHYSPKCVILQGTAGAHDEKLHINDIVIAEKIVSLSNTVSPRKKAGEGTNIFEWETFGIESYSKANGKTDFAKAFFSDKNLVETAKRVFYREGKTLVGTVGSADVWNREADLISFYRNALGTDCEAMEGIGAAQVCEAFGVSMIELRVISNNELNENEKFSQDSAKNIQTFVLDFLKELKS